MDPIQTKKPKEVPIEDPSKVSEFHALVMWQFFQAGWTLEKLQSWFKVDARSYYSLDLIKSVIEAQEEVEKFRSIFQNSPIPLVQPVQPSMKSQPIQGSSKPIKTSKKRSAEENEEKNKAPSKKARANDNDGEKEIGQTKETEKEKETKETEKKAKTVHKQEKKKSNNAIRNLEKDNPKLGPLDQQIVAKTMEINQFFSKKKKDIADLYSKTGDKAGAEVLLQVLIHQKTMLLDTLKEFFSDIQGPAQIDNNSPEIYTPEITLTETITWDDSYRVPDADKNFTKIPDVFASGEVYSTYFKPFVQKTMENEDTKFREEMAEIITFTGFENDYLFFTYTSKHPKLMKGTKMAGVDSIKDGKPTVFEATIVEFDAKTCKVKAQFGTLFFGEERWKNRLNTSTCEKVMYGANLTTFERMLEALNRYEPKMTTKRDGQPCLTPPTPIMNTILSWPEKTRSDVKKKDDDLLPPLNHESFTEAQKDSIKQGLLEPVSLTWGPPGSGKTKVSVCLCSQWAQLLTPKEKVFMTGPSNKSVDAITEYLSKVFDEMKDPYGVSFKEKYPIVRFTSSSVDLESMSPEVKALTLDVQAENHPDVLAARASEDPSLDMRKVIFNAKKKILLNAKIICVTCVSTLSGPLGYIVIKKFIDAAYVLIDEACLATETEILIALQFATRGVRLVGDPCQLRPITLESLKEFGYDRSMFQRLKSLGFPHTMLDVQFRAHPMISAWYRQCVYDGKLKDGIGEEQRDCQFFLPGVSCFQVEGTEQRRIQQEEKSWSNDQEVKFVTLVVEFLVKNVGAQQTEIGIISPYVAQKEKIKNLKDGQSKNSMKTLLWNSVIRMMNQLIGLV